jgi:hypothetical protein
MSTEKDTKKSNRGGARPGAGRPKGSGEKMKICVSVNERNWQAALSKWKKKGSWLVDWLVADFVKRRIPST